MRHEIDPWASDVLYLSITDLIKIINGQTLTGVGLRIQIEPDDKDISVEVWRKLLDCSLLASSPEGVRKQKEKNT